MNAGTQRLLLVILFTAQFISNVDNIITTVAAPAIASSLHATGAELQLVIAAYVIVSAMLLVTCARLGRMYGTRPVFLLGVAVFTAASLASGLAPNALTLIVARTIQGAGAAMMVAQVLSSIQLHVPPAARQQAMAFYTLTLSISGVFAQLIGGALISANVFGSTWRPIFLINVPIGIVLLAAAIPLMPRENAADRMPSRLDIAGVVLSALAMFCMVLPLTLGRELGWPAWAPVMLGAGLLATIAFVVWEKRMSDTGGTPVLNTHVFASRVVRAGLLALVFSRIAVFPFLFIAALYLQAGLGQSALRSGLTLLWWGLGYGAAGPVYPRLPEPFKRLMGPFGAALLTVAFALLALTAGTPAGNGAPLIAQLILGGFGFGALATSTMQYITSATPRVYASDAGGIIASMVPFATVAGVATFGSLFLAHDRSNAIAASGAFRIACAALACSSAVALLAAMAAERGAKAEALAPA